MTKNVPGQCKYLGAQRQQKETEDKLVLADRPQMTKNDLKTVVSKSSTDSSNSGALIFKQTRM